MRLRRLADLRPAFVLAILLAGCSTSPISRIDSNRGLYESWPLEVQQAVLDGRAEKGMTPEMVKMALGEPTEVQSRGGTDEVWIYRKGGGLDMSNANLSMGTSIGGVGVAGPAVPLSRGGGEEEHEVVFEDGVVAKSD